MRINVSPFSCSTTIQFLLLKCRCGVDGFICIARNTHSFDIFPKWYFSEPGISTYLLDYVDIWDEGAIGFHVEKFSLSVCERIHVVIGYFALTCVALSAPDRYATWMRKEIESKVDLLLGECIAVASLAISVLNPFSLCHP